MTVPVSHYERPGSSGTGPQVKSEYDDLGYSAVQFSVDSLDADVVNFEAGKDAYHGGSTAAHNEAMDWGSAMPADDLRFDDFLDLDSMSHTGDEWPDQPDSLFFDMPALDGSTSTTSVSDDFDDLLSCHSQQQHNHQHHLHHLHQHQHQQQQQQQLLQVPPVEARTSTTAGPAATSCMAAGSGVGSASGGSGAIRFPSAHQEDCGPAAEVTDVTAHIRPGKSQPSPAIARGGGPATSKPTPATTTTTTSSSSSSTAAATTGSRSFFKAVASKIQKAATVRSKPSFSRTTINTTERDSSTMSTLSIDRPISPAISPRKAFKLRPDQQQMGIPDGSHPQQQRLPISPPNSATIPQGLSNPFCNGFVEDPFAFDPSVASGPSPAVYKRQAPHTPIDTPVLEDDKSTMYFQQPIHPHQGGIAQANKATWPLPSSSAHADSHGNMAWSNSFAQSDGLDTTQWWHGPVDLNDASSQFQAQNARNATYNLALHTQQAAGGAGRDMAYEYHDQGQQQQQHMPTAGNPHEMSGLMIQMSQANRSSSSPVVQSGAYTHMPQHHHAVVQHHQQQLQHQMPPQPQTERRPRMPRAPSAGARHMTTPMRRQRPSSANRNRARDSSSASPTPNGRAGSSGALGLGIGMGDGGGGGGGFVNFTPSDHTLLMTGVAPSGSSKTKARREKEALEKRRRMSEAALKAVAAAGGDIDKLVEEGFVF
ncbi:hypothetical protein VdG1_05521 [Verticillium dahliae VDG1]|nr:hypothetical protein VdG1_05521 [Verticillium dahliae VDG1]